MSDLKLSKDQVALCVAGSRDIPVGVATRLIEYYARPIISRLGAVFVGDANGVDRGAYVWAQVHGIQCVQFRANWDDEGKKAGPLRNARMVAALLEQPCHLQGLVIYFPHSRGSQDSLRRLHQAGIPTWTVRLDSPPTKGAV